jgi:hypothetical protein
MNSLEQKPSFAIPFQSICHEKKSPKVLNKIPCINSANEREKEEWKNFESKIQ